MGFTILEKLMQHSPGIVARADLEFHLWGDEPPGSDALRTHIATLRAAIDPPGLAPILLTHRGIGYQLLSSRRLSP
jgi:DNA-binding response OmpR family regulator